MKMWQRKEALKEDGVACKAAKNKIFEKSIYQEFFSEKVPFLKSYYILWQPLEYPRRVTNGLLTI